MDRVAANRRFAEADALFRQGDYAESLVVLDELYDLYPEEHRLLRARAETLARLGRVDEALDTCDRLLDHFHYEKIRPLRDQLLSRGAPGDAPLPFMPPDVRERSDELSEGDDEVMSSRRRFRVKPVRLALLLAIVAGMYYQYVPYWLGIGLIAGYLIVRWAIARAIRRLFMMPFRMKGQALAGATVEVHAVTPAPMPVADDEADDDGPAPESLRWVYIDATIHPKPRTHGFILWEPGELVIAPASVDCRSLDDLDRCIGIHRCWIVENGTIVEDEGMKYQGPLRIKIHVGLPSNEVSFRFVYYTETFGTLSIPDS